MLLLVYPFSFYLILKNNDGYLINNKNIVQPDISVICNKHKLIFNKHLRALVL